MTLGYHADLLGATLHAEDHHFWYRARREVIGAALDTFLPESPRRVLELGCGNGNVLALLSATYAGALVAGVDGLPSGLRLAHRRSGRPTVQARIDASPPFRAASFDLVGAFDVIEHLDDDHAALTSVRELLRPGGRVVLTVPADPSLWSAFDVASQHRRRYRPAELHAGLGAAGLDVEYLTPFMAPLVVPARLRRRGAGDTSQVLRRELRVRPGLNSVLYHVCRQEARVVRRRGRLPTGTSLLAVGTRP